MLENPPQKCPLCLHPESQYGESKIHAWGFSCPRCGKYYISDLLYNQSRFQLDREGCFEWACVAHEWHIRHPYELFVLTNEGKLPIPAESMFPDKRIFTPGEMYQLFPKGAEILDRALLNLSRLCKHPMDVIEPSEENLPYLTFTPKQNVSNTWTYLKQMGLIQDANSTLNQRRATITPHGWERIAELSEVRSESSQAFVAMWFAEEMGNVFKEGIEQAITDAGYDCRRIDIKEHNNDICDEIIAEIRKSRFVVADFTASRCLKCSDCDFTSDCRDQVRPRGGVYFEAGFALGLGIPVVWMVRKDQIDDVHFDTRQYNHVIYESASDLRAKLYNRIVATIGEGPKKKANN